MREQPHKMLQECGASSPGLPVRLTMDGFSPTEVPHAKLEEIYHQKNKIDNRA